MRDDDPGPVSGPVSGTEETPSSGGDGRAPRIAPRLAGGNVHEAIAGEVGQRIVRGDYPPGAVLPNEAQWAQTFDVSRSAVREAIKMLMAKGLLQSRPRIGSRVEPRERWNLLDRDVLGWYARSPGREPFMQTVQEFRRIIEPQAAALAAERRTDEDIRAIEAACAEMGEARSLAARTEADARFHIGILAASGNELLMPLGVLIESALQTLFAVSAPRDPKDLRFVQDLHEAIVRCIRERDAEAARRAAERLLANTDAVIGHRAGSRGLAK